MRMLKLIAVCCFLAACVPAAWPATLAAPEWRCQRGATHALWGFASDANPATPETLCNPHGPADALMTLGEFGKGWYETMPACERIGMWDLGRNGTISIQLPQLTVGQAYGEIQVRVIFLRELHQDPSVNVANATLLNSPSSLSLKEIDIIGGGWFQSSTRWQTSQASLPAAITITASYYGSMIDEIEVDAQVIRSWPIPGDANMDCRVNILDLIFVRNRLNQNVNTGDNWQADVNEDGKINVLDLIFVRNWLNGACP